MEPNIKRRAEWTKEDGSGMYLPGETEGAYPVGTRIVKVESEEGDGTKVGTAGVVLSSFDTSTIEVPEGARRADYFYFVKWDDFEHPVGVSDWKIGKEACL